MNICFETFGCRLNRAEALVEEARYLAAGYRRVESHAEADVIVIRGCSVTARAQRDCERLVAHLRRKYPCKRLVIRGCLKTDRKSLAPLPESDEFVVPVRTARAYLKVQDGCSGGCSFCIVPKFRGQPVSVPFDTVLGRARQFADAGYRELVVTGCNLSLYADGARRLPDLVAALADASPEVRVRLGSLEPGGCAAETVSAMAGRANVCRFVHLSVQSGSNAVLRQMRRKYVTDDVEALVGLATAKMPGLGLGCDMIAGFPGETEIDHRASVGLLKRLPFNRIHAFPFSSRPGTLAVALPNHLEHGEKSLRARALGAVVNASRERFALKLKGQTVEIAVEDEGKTAGWTSEYLWCAAEGAVAPRARAKRRELVRLKVSGADRGVLRGNVIG